MLAEYDKENNTLVIEFKGGSRYRYKDVPEEVWIAYKGAESVGKFFYKYIKDKYDYERS